MSNELQTKCDKREVRLDKFNIEYSYISVWNCCLDLRMMRNLLDHEDFSAGDLAMQDLRKHLGMARETAADVLEVLSHVMTRIGELPSKQAAQARLWSREVGGGCRSGCPLCSSAARSRSTKAIADSEVIYIDCDSECDEDDDVGRSEEEELSFRYF